MDTEHRHQQQRPHRHRHRHRHPRGKWRGDVTVDLPAWANADLLWSLLGDFCSLHKWVPTLDVCRRVSGADGQPGCIRYCSGAAGWSKERLVAVDHPRRFYSYEVVDNNIGIGRYAATLRVVPGRGGGGAKLWWSFDAEPMEGSTLEGFLRFLAVRAEAIAVRLEEAAAPIARRCL